MIFVIGAFFWALALAAVSRLLYASRTVIRTHAWLWGLLILIAIGLLFRPHEDIFGGEDPGSYLNSGVTYGRQASLFYIDPLLAQVPPETRSDFYYGHYGYGTTKDACLWVVNTNTALLGPHFQPAYPLLISVVTRLGSNSWALYVVPLFALFMGLVLMTLASRLLAHRLASLIAFGCYILNPLTLWHARCARPEIIAGFMVFAGLALLLLAWQARSRRQWWDILLGALCIGAAPFFHITAWYLVIPTAIAVGLVILRGRTDFLLYPLVALGLLFLFYAQTRYFTDYYHVQRLLEVFFNYWPLLAIGLVALAGSSVAMSRARTGIATDGNSIRPPKAATVSCSRGGDAVATGGIHALTGAATKIEILMHERRSVSAWLACALALVCTFFLVYVYFNRESMGSIALTGSTVQKYNFLTDWKTFANMVSWPMALLILAGWAAWVTGDRLWRSERIGLALIVFPALILAGTMRDFMMTRYLLLAVIPMSALCLTALAIRLPVWPGRPWTAWLAPGLAAAICLLGLTQREHLVSMVEHRGFLRFLAPFARTIQQDHGILLGEYSRLTAPLEHFFGITALGLDNERKDNYSDAERAWETIMRAHPEQPAFFTTPFQMPRSDRFDFKLVKQAVFNDRKLQQAYNTLPTRIQEMPLSLSLYQMALKDDARPATLLTNAMAMPMESGNMGVLCFANLRVDKPILEGIALSARERVSLTIPANLKSDLQELFLVMYSSDPQPMAPVVNAENTLPQEWNGFQFQRLDDHWWIYTCRPTMATASTTLTLTARSPLFIAEALGQTKTNMVSISAGFSKNRRQEVMPPLKGRWARANAAIFLPAAAPGYMFLLVFTPALSPDGAAPSLTLHNKANTWHSSAFLNPGTWQWLIFPLPVENNREAWIRFQIQPVWNPHKAGFPPDLGVFFGKLIMGPGRQDGRQTTDDR